MTLKASVTAVAAAAAALGLAACGGGSKAGGIMPAPGSGPTNTTISSVPATTTTPTSTTASVTTPTSGPLSKEPTITLPKGSAPTKLKITDLIKGTGATAAKGDTVYVNYVGELYKNGKVFDASWKDTPGKTFSFVLGEGQVIAGWDQGVAGMKVGGRRELIIPPSLAYKNQKQAAIPPNSTLVFVVDLIKVTK